VVLEPAPHDQEVTVLGDFRAVKVSRACGATYPTRSDSLVHRSMDATTSPAASAGPPSGSPLPTSIRARPRQTCDRAQEGAGSSAAPPPTRAFLSLCARAMTTDARASSDRRHPQERVRPASNEAARITGSLPQLQRQRHRGRTGVLLALSSRATTVSRPNARPTRFIARLTDDLASPAGTSSFVPRQGQTSLLAAVRAGSIGWCQ